MIRRYFVGYFGQKPVDAVSEADLERYASGGARTGPRALASSSRTLSTRGEATGCAGPYAALRPLLSRQRGRAGGAEAAATLGLAAGLSEDAP